MVLESGPSLIEAAKWIEEFRGSTVVVKLGGELLQRPTAMQRIVQQVAVLANCGLNPILVHGAGVQMDAACKERGIEIKKIDGRRITTPEARDVLVDVLRGLNADLISSLCSAGVSATGLIDGSAVVCSVRPSSNGIDWGEVGDVRRIDASRLSGSAPVLPSLGMVEGDPSRLLNVNADTVASRVAVEVKARKLIFLTSVPGVMRSLDDAGPISWMSVDTARGMVESPVVTGGMKAKLLEALRAIEGGVPMVHILSGTEPFTLLREIFTDEGCGTYIS